MTDLTFAIQRIEGTGFEDPGMKLSIGLTSVLGEQNPYDRTSVEAFQYDADSRGEVDIVEERWGPNVRREIHALPVIETVAAADLVRLSYTGSIGHPTDPDTFYLAKVDQAFKQDSNGNWYSVSGPTAIQRTGDTQRNLFHPFTSIPVAGVSAYDQRETAELQLLHDLRGLALDGTYEADSGPGLAMTAIKETRAQMLAYLRDNPAYDGPLSSVVDFARDRGLLQTREQLAFEHVTRRHA